MENFNPGTVEIIRAELISYDGSNRRDISTNYIYGFEINQSMEMVAYSGTVEIIDTSNVLEGMPIQGEETINLSLKSMDLETETNIAGIVHKVSNIRPRPSSNGVTYTLHFISKQSFKASTRKVLTHFFTTPSMMARDIFRDNYSSLKPADFNDPMLLKTPLPYESVCYDLIKGGADPRSEPDRRLYVQPAKNRTQLIIPDLEPAESMFFVSSRAYNPSTPSQTFRFFETIEDYYWCTDEFFIKRANNVAANDREKVPTLFYAPVVDLDGTNAEAQFNRIEDLQVLSKGIDTSTDIMSGAYTNRVVEIDLVRKKLTDSLFDFEKTSYIDMSGKPRDLNSNPHTEKFRKETFTKDNARTFMVFKDYSGNGDTPSNLKKDQFFTDIVQNRVSYYHHLNNTEIIAKLKGRLDLRPGMLINLDIKALDFVDSNVTINETLAGRYLIKTTAHAMDKGVLNTTIIIVKFDHSGQAEDSRAETVDIGVGI